MLAEVKIGPRVLADGAQVEQRGDKSAALVVADGHGRYQEPVYRQRVWTAAGQAAVSLGAGLSATSVWSLYNPIGSGVNLVLLEFTFAFSAAPAAAAVVFLTIPGTTGQATPTGLTLLATPWSNALVGSAFQSSVARVYTAATLAAVPIVYRVLGSVVAVGSLTPPTLGGEIAGLIIVPPGAHVTLQASAAASGFPSMTWEEIPI